MASKSSLSIFHRANKVGFRSFEKLSFLDLDQDRDDVTLYKSAQGNRKLLPHSPSRAALPSYTTVLSEVGEEDLRGSVTVLCFIVYALHLSPLTTNGT